MEQIIDSYTGAPTETSPVSGNANGVDSYTFGQTFRGHPYSSSRLTKASFNVSRVGTLTGNVAAVLYSLKPSIDDPTRYSVPDTILQTSTSIPVSSISTTAGWVDFTFPGTYVLSPNTKYGICVQYTNTNTTSSYIAVGDTFPAGSATEGHGIGTDSISTFYIPDIDVPFRVYAIVNQTLDVSSTSIAHSNPDATGPIVAVPTVGNGGGLGSTNTYSTGYAQVFSQVLSEILLAISNASHDNTISPLSLSQAQSIAIAAAAHAHAADSPTLTVAYTLALANAVHSIVSPSLDLSGDYFLLVDPALHSTLSTSPTLQQLVSLITQNASHTITSSDFVMQVASLLDIPPSTIEQFTTDVLALRQSTVLDADDAIFRVLSDASKLLNLTDMGIAFGQYATGSIESGVLDSVISNSGIIGTARVETGILLPAAPIETGALKTSNNNR